MAWSEALKASPVPDGQRVLFIRRWLGRDDGERPGEVQAACWLALKRDYMEMRPALRHVYLVLAYLVDREVEAVTHERLLSDVWGSHYTGFSNKFDAVVVGLRRKQGEGASCIETVAGVGYRYRRIDHPGDG